MAGFLSWVIAANNVLFTSRNDIKYTILRYYYLKMNEHLLALARRANGAMRILYFSKKQIVPTYEN